jgi:dihydropteroate synthase
VSDQALFPAGRVTILGVVNVTPDSFSDGGRFVREGGSVDVDAAVAAGRRLLDAGAHWLDVGGESTRPGAADVDTSVEIDRVAPVVEALVAELGASVSVDTRKGAVARAGIAAGAGAINDVSGGRHDRDLLDACAPSSDRPAGTHVILGHMRGTPATMQDSPHFDDVLLEVASELEGSLDAARQAGVPDDKLSVDPGIGFGKRLEDNLALIAHAGWFRERLGRPVLVGPSRKSFLGRITGDPVDERETATVAACAVSAFAGADGVRVHDPEFVRRAVLVGRALRQSRRKELS